MKDSNNQQRKCLHVKENRKRNKQNMMKDSTKGYFDYEKNLFRI